MLVSRAILLGAPDNLMKLTCEVANTEDEMRAVRELMGLSEIR